jgi:hypothetical protein
MKQLTQCFPTVLHVYERIRDPFPGDSWIHFCNGFFFPLNRVIAKTRKVRSRITRVAYMTIIGGRRNFY